MCCDKKPCRTPEHPQSACSLIPSIPDARSLSTRHLIMREGGLVLEVVGQLQGDGKSECKFCGL
jgi:hypothetical protein